MIPDPKVCVCGHTYRWYIEDTENDTDSIFYELEEELGLGHYRQHSDTVSRPCPHRNGTHTEHCPQCDRQVAMWGVGPAGGMECTCWDKPVDAGRTLC